jgi:hypothetical protein
MQCLKSSSKCHRWLTRVRSAWAERVLRPSAWPFFPKFQCLSPGKPKETWKLALLKLFLQKRKIAWNRSKPRFESVWTVSNRFQNQTEPFKPVWLLNRQILTGLDPKPPETQTEPNRSNRCHLYLHSWETVSSSSANQNPTGSFSQAKKFHASPVSF